MNSFAYGLDRLKKFNDFVAQTPQLRDFFITKDFNYLQTFQAGLLFDFKYYYEKNSIRAPHQVPELAKVEGVSSWIKHLLALLVSCLALLKMCILRPKVAVLCVDKFSPKFQADFRIEGIYDYLKQNHITFLEIMHTVIGGHFKKFLFKRKRAVFYLETPDTIFKLFSRLGVVDDSHPDISKIDLSSFQEEQEMIRIHLMKYFFLRQQRNFRIKFFRRIFKLSSIKKVLTIDDTRHYYEITAGAHASNIKVYAFQHGAFCKYTVGWIYCGYGRESIVKPDRLFVWGKYWKDELLRLGTYFTDQELAYGGNPKSLGYSGNTSIIRKPHEKIVILMPYEIEAPKAQVRELVYKILACPNTEFIFKVRPDLGVKPQLVEYGFKEPENMPENFRVTAKTSLEDMAKVDVIIGTHSTYLYEVLDYLIPVFIIDTELDYSGGMVHNGLAGTLSSHGDICKNLKDATEMPQEVLQRRKGKFYESFGSLEDTLTSVLNG